MTTKYQQEGDVIQYTNSSGSTIASGTVLKMKNLVGVVLADIKDGATGSVAIEGVFVSMPKTTGVAWVVGDGLLWDVSASKFDTLAATPATGDVSGCAVAFEAAASGDTTGVVLLTPTGRTLIT